MRVSWVCVWMAVLCVSAGSLAKEPKAMASKAQSGVKATTPRYFLGNGVAGKTGKRLVENPEVVALSQTPEGQVLFTAKGAFLDVAAASGPNTALEQAQRVVLQLGFSGQDGKQRPHPPRLEERLSGKVNFLKGPASAWKTDLPTYGRLVYDDVWPGISLAYQGGIDGLSMHLEIEAGADTGAMVLETGGTQTKILTSGELVVTRDGGSMRLGTPYAYEERNGARHPVAVSFVALKGGQVSLALGAHDPKVRLRVETALIWSGYLGGPGIGQNETSKRLVRDSSGNVYVIGASSSGFPTTTGAYDTSSTTRDVVLTKMDGTGSTLLFSTFLGGSGQETGNALRVASDGGVVIAGATSSTDFPTTSGVLDETYADGIDAFVAKINNTGTALVFSTFLGSTQIDQAFGLALDTADNIYVTGSTYSSDFPTTMGAFDTSANGDSDLFITSLNANATALRYSSYLGGVSTDYAFSIEVDTSGNAFLFGSTYSGNMPTTGGAYDATANGGMDTYLAKVNPTGTALVFATYLGGDNEDQAWELALGEAGGVIVTGGTISSDYPTTAGAFSEFPAGNFDAFVTSILPNGSGLVFSTLIGGAGYDFGMAIARDDQGALYVGGRTSSPDFPATIGSYDPTLDGTTTDGFVLKLNATGSALNYATYLGGGGEDSIVDLVLDDGSAVVLGDTTSSDFPVTLGVFDGQFNGQNDSFVAKIDAAGVNLTFSTFLGSPNEDELYVGPRIAVDADGYVYTLAHAGDSGFPVQPGAYNEHPSGGGDLVLTKMKPDGSDLVYSTYLGGQNQDLPAGLAVDGSGMAYVASFTDSPDFPVSPGAFDKIFDSNLESDGTVSKLTPSGNGLVYSTYLGGNGIDQPEELVLGENGTCYVSGYTQAIDFPTTVGCYRPTFTGVEIFVTHFNADGSGLLFSTFVLSQLGRPALTVDGTGHVYLATATSNSHPVTAGAYDPTPNGGSDIYLTKLNPTGTTLVAASFLGGSGYEIVKDLQVDGDGSMYIVGSTQSTDFPVTAGGALTAYAGGTQDGFVAKLSSDATTLTYATYLGGSESDEIQGLGLDSAGAVYFVGSTESNDFPVTMAAFDETYNENGDFVVGRLYPTGSSITYSTYLGGSSTESASVIALSHDNMSYIAGLTTSDDNPLVGTPYQDELRGPIDLLVAKLNVCPRPKPGSITGDNSVCAAESGVIYSIDALAGASGYTWTVPAGAVITSGQGSTQITVTFGSSSGSVTVQAEFDCGPSEAQELAVSLGVPAQPGSISGETVVCPNETGLVYSIDPVPNTTLYTWTVPSGAQIMAGQGTTSVTVDLGSTLGAVSVAAGNDCGQGTSATLSLSFPAPFHIQTSSGNQVLCPEQTLSVEVMAQGLNLGFQWLKDGNPLVTGGRIHGAQTDALTVDPPLTNVDEGVYTCEVSNDCGTDTETITLSVSLSDQLAVAVSPPSAVQGLLPVVLEALPRCVDGAMTVRWTDPLTGDVFTGNPFSVTVEQTTRFDVQVTDNSGTANGTVWVLYPLGSLDLNNDGVNDRLDLTLLLPSWQVDNLIDLNGDGVLNILDFLYINTGL